MALIEDLQPSDQELIKNILRKDVKAWSENDKAILRARAAYLDEKTLELVKEKPVVAAPQKAVFDAVVVEDKPKVEKKKRVFGRKERKDK